jgi:hypothetical protein
MYSVQCNVAEFLPSYVIKWGKIACILMAYIGSRGTAPLIFKLGARFGECGTSYSCHFILEQRATSSDWIGSHMSPRASLHFGENKIL